MGRLLTVLGLWLGALSLGCKSEAPSQPAVPPTASPTGTKTYLALGDSYTIGQNVPEADRWPVRLAELLRKNGGSVAQPDIIARTGWTTAELQSAISRSGNTTRYDLVSLLIGVNNQYRGQSLETYRNELRELLATATGFAGGNSKRVLVLSIPDWGATPYGASANPAGIAKEIDAFNAVAREECGKAGIDFIDITTTTRTARNDPDLVASDGLHYSGKMHQLWAELALDKAREILNF